MSKPPNPELTRRVLEIALDELGSKPPEKVSMRGIAERAGVSPTAIYYYFDSKEAIFERIKFDAMAELDARLNESQRSEDGPAGKLASMVRAYVEWCLERPHLARLLMEELPAQTELTEESMAKYYSTFFRARDLLQEAIAAGAVEDRDLLLDISVAQAAIWGIIEQFRTKRVHPRFWESIDPLIGRFIELFLGQKGM